MFSIEGDILSLKRRLLGIQVLIDFDILTVGLSCVGFDKNRQLKENLARNMKRFKQFFGPDSTTIAPLLRDLRQSFPELK